MNVQDPLENFSHVYKISMTNPSVYDKLVQEVHITDENSYRTNNTIYVGYNTPNETLFNYITFPTEDMDVERVYPKAPFPKLSENEIWQNREKFVSYMVSSHGTNISGDMIEK